MSADAASHGEDQAVSSATNQARSPFHSGERALQERAGVRERMETFGRKVIRDFMPRQHRDFYTQLPMLIIGHADEQGRPWCSLLAGKAGFVSSPDERTLELNGGFLHGDPVRQHLAAGRQFGLLGIEMRSRRRNRMNGSVLKEDGDVISLHVDQAFGNCPQYIQARDHAYVEPAASGSESIERFTQLPESVKRLIAEADTFFVSSRAPVERDERSEGIDASHRGGRPGFVRIDDDRTLTIPDYAGNFHFNTLGNFLVDPRAGLLFTDFESGDVVMLTGGAEVLWDSDEAEVFKGAERLWRFRLDEGFVLPAASPLRWRFGDYSPNTLITGTWDEAEAVRAANAERCAWREYRVTNVVDESLSIRSFYLAPADGGALPSFEPGQYLTVRVKPVDGDAWQIRTYSVSGAPGDPELRISVKREPSASADVPPGVVSNHLHTTLNKGDVLEARAPQGDFTFDASAERPAVMIAGGVGITPMISMLRHAVQDRTRSRHLRPIVFISAARSSRQRAFHKEVAALEQLANGAVDAYSVLSQPDSDDQRGRDFDARGRVSREMLQAVLPIDDYDFYICGPAGFMQGVYDAARDLGVNDARIHAEAFGPAALARRYDEGAAPPPGPEVAKEAVVTFVESGFEMAWTPEDGTLLELAEAHGLSPAYGCRNGACGSCAVPLESGRVAYRTPPRADTPDDSVLICCAVPGQAEDKEAAAIRLGL